MNRCNCCLFFYSSVLGAYSGQDITLTLPASMSVTELRWLSIYCIQLSINFGEVFFPANLNVPP